MAAVPPAARTRRLWPVVVLSLVGVVAVVAAAAIALPLVAAAQQETDAAAVEQVVHDFASAYDAVDCDLFETLSTDDVRDDMYRNDGYACSYFEDIAESLHDDDGEFTLTVDIERVRVRGDSATVETSEKWGTEGDEYESDVTYGLDREDGSWIITDYDEELQ